MRTDHVLQLHNVTATSAGRALLTGITLTATSGRVLALVGPNGAGKSTLLHRMTSLRPGGGTIAIAGTSYTRLRSPARHVGVMLDALVAAPSHTATQHLRMVAAAAQIPATRITPLLHEVGLSTQPRLRVRHYSLGMKQRLALATALLGDPVLLILDEPGNGLDPSGLRWLNGTIRNRADRGAAVVVSSHALESLVHIADDIAVLARGQLVAAGPVDEFLDRYGHALINVRSHSPDVLAAALVAQGATIVERRRNRISVAGLSTTQIAQTAHNVGSLITELVPATTGIDDAFHNAIGANTSDEPPR
ncbi:MAG: ABC transporter ATP-binding protein [Mycetocola sp.]